MKNSCLFWRKTPIFLGGGRFFSFSRPGDAAGFPVPPRRNPSKARDALIQEGLDAYQLKKYERATEAFQKMKDRFPYSQYAVLAELKLADSYYLNKDYELAATGYKEFEKMHPTNEVIAYVVFMQGMSLF